MKTLKKKNYVPKMKAMPASLATNTVSRAGKAAGNVAGQTVNLTTKTVGMAGTAVNMATLGMAGTGVNAVGKMGKYASKKLTGKGRRAKLHKQHSWLAWDSRVTAPFIKLDLLLECHRLPKKDSFCPADAFACVWEVPSGFKSNSKRVNRMPTRQEREIGRTEIVRGNRDPLFSTTFRLEFKFHEEQTYLVRVYNEDLRYSTDLKEHDFIGGCIFTLGELLGSSGCSIAMPLYRGKSFVVLTGREIVETREVLEFRFSGQDLGLLERKNNKAQVAKDVLETMQKLNVAKTVLEKFDSYFRIEKLDREDQSWSMIWKSEVVSDNENPTWNAARLPLQLLCGDEPTNPLKISIWVWNRFIPDESVGFVETSVDELIQKAKRGIPVFNVMAERRKLFGGVKLKKAGVLKGLKSSVLQIPSMLQYISGGCEMDLIFAIDCSDVNGDWRNANSLHFHSEEWLNDYQAIIHKVGTIYDGFEKRQKYTMFGYGARIEGVNQQCFSLGENLQNADDLVNCYDDTFSQGNCDLELGARVELKHVVQSAVYRSIRLSQQRQSFSTLVVLSTGAIDDLAATIDVVCAAAEDAPLSIVIVGIGNDGNFETIHKLTGAEQGKLRHSNGVPIARDIVHFVPMHEFHGNVRACVAESLHDVPEQFVQHFTNAGIKPNPPRAVPDFSLNQVFGEPHSRADNLMKKGSSHKDRKNGNSSVHRR